MATGIVMILAMIMTLMAWGILGLNREHTIRDIRYAVFHSTLDIININFYAFGQNDRAFKSTFIFNNQSNGGRMDCIRTKSACTHTLMEDIVLRYPTDTGAGTVYYDQMAATGATKDGFKFDGTVCDYNSTQVTNGCQISVRLRWKPFCISDCIIPPNRINFDLTYYIPGLGANGATNYSYLPVKPNEENGPMPIYNPFR